MATSSVRLTIRSTDDSLDGVRLLLRLSLRLEDANGNEYTETQGAFIVQAQALYTRKINEHVEFKQLLVVKHATESGENSNYQAESSLTTKLISTLQLKISFKVDHNTEVAEEKENTNTQTAITLVYSF